MELICFYSIYSCLDNNIFFYFFSFLIFFEIIIFDDGKGIAPKKIKEKFSKMKDLKETNLEKSMYREILDFIFYIVFSNKETINTISERGVGLNAV